MSPVSICLLEFHAHTFLLKGNSFVTLTHCSRFFTVDFNLDTTTHFCAFKTLFLGGVWLLIKPERLLLLLVCGCLGTVSPLITAGRRLLLFVARECAVHVLSTRMVASATGAVFLCCAHLTNVKFFFLEKLTNHVCASGTDTFFSSSNCIPVQVLFQVAGQNKRSMFLGHWGVVGGWNLSSVNVHLWRSTSVHLFQLAFSHGATFLSYFISLPSVLKNCATPCTHQFKFNW